MNRIKERSTIYKKKSTGTSVECCDKKRRQKPYRPIESWDQIYSKTYCRPVLSAFFQPHRRTPSPSVLSAFFQPHRRTPSPSIFFACPVDIRLYRTYHQRHISRRRTERQWRTARMLRLCAMSALHWMQQWLRLSERSLRTSSLTTLDGRRRFNFNRTDSFLIVRNQISTHSTTPQPATCLASAA